MRNIRQLLVAFLMSAVVACGGGGSIGGGGTTTTPVYTLALSMSDAAGQAATTVSKASPLTVTVKLSATNGGAISGKLVTFTLNDGELASFNNGAGTAQTNASGEASIGLLVGNKSGAGMVTATLASGEKAEITFSSAGDGGVVGAESNVSVRLLKSDGTVSNDLSIATPLTIEATFTSSKVAVAGQIISFQLSDSALAKFSNSTASAITDSTGVARLALSVGTKNGVGTITPIHAGQAYTAVAFNSAGDDPSGQAAVITLTLQTKTGVVSSQISKDVPLDAVVVLKSATGVPVADKQINFEINIAGLAYFGNQTATARTDATGTAKIGLTAGTTNGTGTITASLDTDENIAASRPFDSAGDGGPITSDPVSSVLLQSDKLQLGSGSTDKIELTAIVKDSNQVLLKDSKVTFAIETGSDAELEVVSGTTNNMGVATATLTSRSNLTLRDVLVSATAGSSSKKSVLTIKVVGTDIQVVAPSAVVLGNAVDLSFDLIDSASQPIRNTGMQLTSSLNNQFSNASPVTDTSTGRAVVKYTASTSGSDIVTVTALGVTKSFTILVNSDAFGFVVPSNQAAIPEIPLNTSASAKIKWTRNASPMVGEPVSFATTRGYVGATALALDDKKIVASNTTDSAGEAEVFMKSEFAGLANVSASTTGSLLLQTQKIVEFVATVPSGPLEVQAFPAQLGVGEKAIVQAIVRDSRNNPVKNQQVAFTLIDAAGGQLSPATAITNSQGIAATEFLADATTPGGGTSGEPKGLKISATLVADNAITGSTSIAVGNRTLFFRFATGNTIRSSTNGVLYLKDYAVLVTDSSGNPVANQSLNVSIAPKRYAKGRWFKSPIGAAFKSWVPKYSNAPDDPTCASEDINKNGILDRGPNGVGGEDANGDGQLTPGNVATVERTVTGGADGIAYFTLTYPKEMGAFVTVDVTVSGIASGTENVYSRELVLDYDSADVTKEESRPWDSPFGIDATTDTGDDSATAYTSTAICSVNP